MRIETSWQRLITAWADSITRQKCRVRIETVSLIVSLYMLRCITRQKCRVRIETLEAIIQHRLRGSITRQKCRVRIETQGGAKLKSDLLGASPGRNAGCGLKP